MDDDAKATVEEPREETVVVNLPQPPEDPPKVEEPKSRFVLKVSGVEEAVELTHAEIVRELQLARDYQKKTTQLAEMRRRVEPYLEIMGTQAFEAFLQQLQGEQPEQKSKELYTRMKRGDVSAAAMLILQRSRGIQT